MPRSPSWKNTLIFHLVSDDIFFKQRLADSFQAKLREEWASALTALDHRDDANAKHVREISCPDDYDYELDSDFEDEDKASPPVELCGSSPPYGRNRPTLEGKSSIRTLSARAYFGTPDRPTTGK